MAGGSADRRPDARSAHREETRQALVEAALSLFAAKGYDATSVEEITEWAGVSPRTFFRYFESKDRVLLFGGDAFNRAVVRALPDQPAELGDLAALAATLGSLTPLLTPLKQRIRLYYRAVRESTTLAGHHTRATAQHNAAVAQALAARRSLEHPDERCYAAAALAAIALERSYAGWLSSRRDLAELLDESFAVLRAVVTADVAGGSAPPG
ncbi:MAG TPA: helix-turn-helix domain-containing protein [Blastococcus sp.]|jgi:AcrR family transcriptional regulator|nr:putative tetR family transcriptional regulator [Blastococcus sp.]